MAFTIKRSFTHKLVSCKICIRNYYFCSIIMFEDRKWAFFNYFGKRRRLSVDNSFEEWRGVNDNSPFFVCRIHIEGVLIDE